MCRSVPQIVAVSIRTIASVSAMIAGSGTVSQERCPGPWKTSAFMVASFFGAGRQSKPGSRARNGRGPSSSSLPVAEEELDERRVRRKLRAELGEQAPFFEERALLARARLGDVHRCE